MYLADKINSTLDKSRIDICRNLPFAEFTDTMNHIFRKFGKIEVEYEFSEKLDSNYYTVAGLYDTDTDTRYLHYFVPPDTLVFDLSDKGWADFRFLTSQVLQHETLHQIQAYNRGSNSERWVGYTCAANKWSEDMDYLSNHDEIEAYAHDIAMEVVFRYPNENPLDVVRNIGRRRKIFSYGCYTKTFRGVDWSKVHKALLTKVIKWLPHVKV